MAEGNGDNDRNTNNLRKIKVKGSGNSEEQSEDSEDPSVQPDLGIGDSSRLNTAENPSSEGTSSAGQSGDPPLRMENPMSFKRFLNSSGTSSSGGSRLKLFNNVGPSPTPPRLVNNSDMASGLPDFVQDHLVVEQCYLNSGSPQQLSVDLGNIPHFPCGGEESAIGMDLHFDLMAERGLRPRAEEACGPPGPVRRDPLDLPAAAVQEGEPSKSLPDFLSDGPIRRTHQGCSGSEPTCSPGSSSSDLRQYQIENNRLRIENERLRREMDALRRQICDQIVRSETLEMELRQAHQNSDQATSSSLQVVVDQMNEETSQATKRAVAADCRAEKLKLENQALRNEIENLRGGRVRDTGASTSAVQSDTERLASQLRNAANTAELSLRHLLIGVDNLRLLAASLENSQPNLRPSRCSVPSDSDESMD